MRKTVNTICQTLIREGWRTPNTYSGEYQEIPDLSGIYSFLVFDRDYLSPKIAYVGKSLKLRQRISGHEVLREIDMQLPGAFIQRWFLQAPRDQIDQIEVKIIKRFNPPYNIQHKRRGVYDWHF